MIPIIVTCMITALLAIAISNQTTYAGNGKGTAISARIVGIAKQGKPNDRIPVIIQLQPQSTMPIGRLSITQKTAYLSQIAQQQQLFIQQNNTLLTNIKGTTKTTAVIFATVLRSNLVTLASQKHIVGIEIDKPQTLQINESGETIGSRAAVLSGYDGTGTSVAILDTGVAKHHVFLEGQVIAEACFSSTITTASATSYSLCPAGAASSTAVDSGLPCPMTLSGCGSGTHVAGIIAGKRMNPPMNTTGKTAPVKITPAKYLELPLAPKSSPSRCFHALHQRHVAQPPPNASCRGHLTKSRARLAIQQLHDP
jgi:subtilisin family serine protease